MKVEDFLNHEVNAIFGGKKTVGNKFGVELELEGKGVGLADIPTRGWGRDKEPSLRGEAIEYTFNTPKTLDESKTAVSDLFKKFAANGVKLNDSFRTSTHVHLNFSDKKVKAALNFFSVFTVVEELLTAYSGEDRSGNLFCITSRDAEGMIRLLSSDLSSGNLRSFTLDKLKYAACNLCTLHKFNTLEVRTMRGAESAEMVNEWLDILNELYEYSLKMVSPAELPNQLSMFGAGPFLSRIFSEKSKAALLRTFPRDRDLHDSLMEGVRLIQLFAYEYDAAFKVDKVIVAAKGRKMYHYSGRDGRPPAVYLPDGRSWSCFPPMAKDMAGKGFWDDGDACNDDPRVVWNEDVGLFYVQYPEGPQYLRWARHDDFGNQGPAPAALRKRMPELQEDPMEEWNHEELEIDE